MKVYRTIVIVISIIVGLSIVIFFFFGPATQAAIKEPHVNEEYYNMLKENALNLAKTLDKDVITDKTLTSDFYFNQDELVVTVKSYEAKLTATVPILNHSFNVDNGTIISNGILDLKNIEYVEQNLLNPVWYYIFLSIIVGAGIGAFSYFILFGAWFPTPKTK